MSDCSIAEKLGRQVRALRLERGYSQEAFAEMADLHRTYIGMVERGEKNITVRNAEKIANALNVSLSDIFAPGQLKVLYELFPGSFSVMNAQGKMMAWNPYTRDVLAGKPEEEMYGVDGMAMIHADDREYVAELFSLLITAGGHQTGEARVLIKGGPDYTWRSIHGTRIDVMGEPCVLALGIDITEQKRLEALVQELESQAGSS